MPNNASSEKRRRQNEKRNLKNRSVKSEIKTLTKKLMTAVEKKDKDTATAVLRTTQAKLDKAAKVGVMHRNTVARRKSLLMRKTTSI